MISSLDHSMWFHAPFRADEWMLFDMQSVKVAGGRGTNVGFIYNSSCELAITATQECLIRLNSSSSSNNKESPDASKIAT